MNGRNAGKTRVRPTVVKADIAGCYDVYLGDQRIGFFVRDIDRSWTAFVISAEDGYPEKVGPRYRDRRQAAAAIARQHGATA